MMIITSANSCINDESSEPCLLLTGSNTAAPERPLVVVMSSPANSAAAIVVAAASPITKPMTDSVRNAAGVMRSAGRLALTLAAGVSSTAKITMSAVRNFIGTVLADHAGATSISPATRSAVSTKAAAAPGAKKSGRPAAVSEFTTPPTGCS